MLRRVHPLKKNLAYVFENRGISYEPLVFEQTSDVIGAYDEGRCDGWTTDKTGLIAGGQLLTSPSDHIIIEETMALEPLAPVVRQGDENWFDIVKATVNCTIMAEYLGVNAANVDQMMGAYVDVQIENLLGKSGDLGQSMNLSNAFCYQVIKKVGNYEEIYNRNLGIYSIFQVPRDLNALWTEGGLLFSPPFR